MPSRLWRMLYRAFDLVGDPGNAARQARGAPLHSIDRRQPVRHLWRSVASGSVQRASALSADVRDHARKCARLPRFDGTSDEPVSLTSSAAVVLTGRKARHRRNSLQSGGIEVLRFSRRGWTSGLRTASEQAAGTRLNRRSIPPRIVFSLSAQPVADSHH
jgi:hypothetical protein